MVEYFVSCYREVHSCDPEVPCCIGDHKKCYRCSIGELTNEQVNDFIKKSGINDIPDFYLNTADELSISTMKGKPVHLEAKECFRSDGYALRRRLMEYFNQADCQMSDKKPPQDSLFISNLPSYLMNMANRNFSVLRRIRPLSTIDSHTLIRRVLRPDWHIPAPFREIIFEFRHIIIMCQFMVDAERIRIMEVSDNEVPKVNTPDAAKEIENSIAAKEKLQRELTLNVKPVKSASVNYSSMPQAASGVHTSDINIILGDGLTEIGDTVGNPLNVNVVNEDSFANKVGKSVAEHFAKDETSTRVLTVSGVKVPGVKIDYEKVVAQLYENRPETILFTSERLLACLKGLPGGENVTITASRLRHLNVWKKYSAVRKSGKEQCWGDMSDFTTEGKLAKERK